MARPTIKLANKEYSSFSVGSAFTRRNGEEVATNDEATTGNRYVSYLVTCKSCGKQEKKTKSSIYADSICEGCGTIHAGINPVKRTTMSSLTVFFAGNELVMFRLAPEDAEAVFRTNLDYSIQYSRWKSSGSEVFYTEADLLRTSVNRAAILEKSAKDTLNAPSVMQVGGLPTYSFEAADAQTKAAYEAELGKPIQLPAPSGQPLGEVFTTSVTRATLEKHSNYFDDLGKLAKAIGLRPPAPNQRSGWLAPSSIRNIILAKSSGNSPNFRLPPIYQDASARFESVATYPVNDIEEVWYYLYEYAPSSPDDIPDF